MLFDLTFLDNLNRSITKNITLKNLDCVNYFWVELILPIQYRNIEPVVIFGIIFFIKDVAIQSTYYEL